MILVSLRTEFRDRRRAEPEEGEEARGEEKEGEPGNRLGSTCENSQLGLGPTDGVRSGPDPDDPGGW